MSLKYLIVTVIIASVVSGQNQTSSFEETTLIVDQTTTTSSVSDQNQKSGFDQTTIKPSIESDDPTTPMPSVSTTTTTPMPSVSATTTAEYDEAIDELLKKEIMKNIIPRDLVQQLNQIFKEPLPFFLQTFIIFIINWIVMFVMQFIPCVRNAIFWQFIKAARHFFHVDANSIPLLNLRRREA